MMLQPIRPMLIAGLICLLVALSACRPIVAPVVVEQEGPPLSSLEEAQQRAPFAFPQPAWLPENLVLEGVRILSPISVQTVYRSTTKGDGGMGIMMTKGAGGGGYHVPETAKQQVMITEHPGICVQGNWTDTQQWQANADTGLLEWTVDDFHYQINHSELGLTCDELIRIAASIPPPAEV